MAEVYDAPAEAGALMQSAFCRYNFGMRWHLCPSVASVGLALSAVGAAAQPTLTAGATTTHAIRGGETQTFGVDVAAGEFIQVTLDGRGTLLRLTIQWREGETLATRERRAGLRTPIMWAAVADRSTALAFAVTSLEQPGPDHRFAIALDGLL